MATNMDLVLNLRSAREWHSSLELDLYGTACCKSSADAEECARRHENILTAARATGLAAETKSHRKITSPLREDLTLQEALIDRAVQFLQRSEEHTSELQSPYV